MTLKKMQAQNSSKKAGDGTMTSNVMTQALINGGMRAVTAGMNPVALNSGIRKAARIVADEVCKAISCIDDLKAAVAKITSGSVDQLKWDVLSPSRPLTRLEKPDPPLWKKVKLLFID